MEHGTCHEVEISISPWQDTKTIEAATSGSQFVSHASAFNGALSFFFFGMTDVDGFAYACFSRNVHGAIERVYES